MFDYKELKNKIVNGEELSADEVQCIYYGEVFPQVDHIGGDEGRWYRYITVVYEINDSYYSIYYYKGLTEYQEDKFESQVADEVEKRPVTTYEWVEVN
jgi:hypothetical protein